MRIPIIAGNWKLYKTKAEAIELAEGVKNAVANVNGVEVVLCPPFTSLWAVSEIISGSPVKLGAQNMFWEKEGAYTGEVGPQMLKEAGCQYVIIGHSERRQYFGEIDESVKKKVKASLANGLIPIVCVGETLPQREAGETMRVIETQVREGLKGIGAVEFEKLVIAYEPVWAIGTGRTATSAQAEEVHKFIRDLIADLQGSDTAQRTRIQYGGSVKPDNIRELMAQPDVDGALVGGASLKADSFVAIVKGAVG